MTIFDQAFGIVVGIEGDLSLDPTDPGNFRNGVLVGTRYGISAAANPDVDIVNLTLEEAKLLYYSRYWFPSGCDMLEPRAALCMLDAAINEGVKTAVMLMQRACGVAYDGVIGPKSRAVFPIVTNVHVARFMAFRALWYTNTKGFAADGPSWLGRLFTISLAPLETP